MKKVLLVANVSKEHVRKFHIPFILKMREQGWQTDVACRMDAAIPECDHAYPLPCNRNPFDGGLWESIKIVRDLIREQQYDVVHCNTITGSIVARLAAMPFRKRGLKVFYTDHGLHFFKGASLSRWVMGYPIEKLLAGSTDVLITVNKEDYQMANRHLRACGAIEKIDGIGVDLSRFRDFSFQNESRDDVREKIGLQPDSFAVGYVAEIVDNKNQIALLKTLKIVRKSIPNVMLVLVGPEHDGGWLRREALKMGLGDCVLFLGWRNDVPAILHAVDIYAASSKSEGLGLNLIEAMACNLPVVAYENRGHREVIRHKINGILVRQGDYERMASWLVRLYQKADLREKLISNAQRDIAKYETENVLTEILEIYDKYA